jgi:type VI secretion system ImpM family protein
LGDFFRLGVAGDFVPPWDAWLQGTLVAAEQALGGRFEGCYMSAPIWRFALPPGVAGQQGVVGVMMPSIDRVGRRFPLTLLAPTGQGEQAPLRNMIWQAEVLAGLEELALQALTRFGALIRAHNVKQVHAVATAAVREAKDGPRFAERVRSEAGIDLQIIDGTEEARLSALGVLAGTPQADGVVGDLGG